MAVKTFDPKQVIVNIGLQQIGGFADGEFINVSRDEDSFTKVSGADGEVSRSKSNNKMGELTLTLLQTSSSNDILSGFMLADELGNSGIFSVFIKDALGLSTIFAAEGWIKKAPDTTFDKELGNREWVIDLANFDVFVGGN